MNRALRRVLPAVAAVLPTTALAACGTVLKSDIIPGSPVAISTSLSPALQAKIAEAFQTKANVDYLKANGYCSGACTLDGSSWGYAPVNNAFYDPIRKVCDETKNKNCTSAS
jgi:phosphonate transport system substrate-binding protein